MHGWAKFWNDIAASFGYKEWIWGSAGEWAGAIGTAGALIATVVIIASDRQREQRRRANALVSWVAADPWAGTEQATGKAPIVILENTDAYPILALHVYYFDGSGTYIVYDGAARGSKHNTIPAGGSVEIEIPEYQYGKHDRLFIKFIDANNQHWIRNAKTGKYLRFDPWPYSSLPTFFRSKWDQLRSRNNLRRGDE